MMDYDLYTKLNFVMSIDRKKHPCWVCGTPTSFVEICFETYICPGICDWAATTAYFMALRGKDPWRERSGDSPSESSNIYVPLPLLT